MRKTVIWALILILTTRATLRAQEYPFQDTKLPEEERLDNAVSLMTVDEKIATLVGQGVPRLGIAGPGATEAIHGIVRGGATDLPALRGGSNNNRPAAEVRGIQGDDPAYWRGASLMKHFLANSNEDGRIRTDSRFDEALFRDYYSYGFWKGSRAGAMSLMTAYNKYNGIPCMAAPFIREILINEWGMQGSLVDDGGALRFMVSEHHYAPDINEAIKMALEAGLTRFIDSNFEQVKAAYDGGFIRDEVLDARTKSNLRTMLRLGLLDAECPYDAQSFGSEEDLPWVRQESKDKARLVTQKSIVLLKNEGNLLPLDREKVKKIAVFGNRAEQVLKDWYGALPSYRVSPLDGIKAAVDSTRTEVRFQRWDSDGSAQELAKWADVCIVCVGNHPATSPDWDRQSVQSPWAYGTVAGDGREALDRRSLQLETEDLIKVVWQANHNTVVTLISSFPFAINWTAENVPAIVHMTQCSQESGSALADVLFGDYNPAGRLTQTWVRDILDLPNMLDYDIRHGRTYMYAKAKPLFPFGFGLSYTTFKYSHLKVKKNSDNYVVRFDLKNTGSRDGEEVVQLYAKFKDDDASKRLRGFERIPVKAGETVPVEIVVPAEDLKLWNSQAHAWAFWGRKAKLLVGASSEDIRLKKSIKL